MDMERRKLHRKIYVNLLYGVFIVLFVIFVLPGILRFFLPFLIAWIVAMIANPVIHFLEKRIKIMRKHGTALMIILVLAAIGAIIYGLIVFTASQVSSLAESMPEIYETARGNLQHIFQSLHHRYHFIPEDFTSVFFKGENSSDDYIATLFGNMVTSLQKNSFTKMGSMASSVVDFIVYLILTILASYFMTVEEENIIRGLEKTLPSGLLDFFRKVKAVFVKAIGGYMMARFKIMVVVFCVTVIPFMALGISYSALLAVTIAVVDFLPFIGAGTILWPWALYEIVIGSYRYGVVLIVLYIILMILRQLLEPKFIGDSVGISSFETLIFMLIGYRIGGVLGLILGIPAGMILKACYQEGMFDGYLRGIKILVKDFNEYRKY